MALVPSLSTEIQQAVLAEIAVEGIAIDEEETVEDDEILAAIEEELAELETGMRQNCSIVSTKVQVLQNALSHKKSLAARYSDNSNLDENMQYDEDLVQQHFLKACKGMNRKLTAETKKTVNMSAEVQGQSFPETNRNPAPEEPLDANRKLELHQENVRLANILATMTSGLGLKLRNTRLERIENLCEAVHTKNYSSLNMGTEQDPRQDGAQ